jgi:hypothetical protein
MSSHYDSQFWLGRTAYGPSPLPFDTPPFRRRPETAPRTDSTKFGSFGGDLRRLLLLTVKCQPFLLLSWNEGETELGIDRRAAFWSSIFHQRSERGGKFTSSLPKGRILTDPSQYHRVFLPRQKSDLATTRPRSFRDRKRRLPRRPSFHCQIAALTPGVVLNAIFMARGRFPPRQPVLSSLAMSRLVRCGTLTSVGRPDLPCISASSWERDAPDVYLAVPPGAVDSSIAGRPNCKEN